MDISITQAQIRAGSDKCHLNKAPCRSCSLQATVIIPTAWPVLEMTKRPEVLICYPLYFQVHRHCSHVGIEPVSQPPCLKAPGLSRASVWAFIFIIIIINSSSMSSSGFPPTQGSFSSEQSRYPAHSVQYTFSPARHPPVSPTTLLYSVLMLTVVL